MSLAKDCLRDFILTIWDQILHFIASSSRVSEYKILCSYGEKLPIFSHYQPCHRGLTSTQFPYKCQCTSTQLRVLDLRGRKHSIHGPSSQSIEISLYNCKITRENCAPLINMSIDDIVLSEELNEPQGQVSISYFWGDSLNAYTNSIYFLQVSSTNGN